MLYLNIHLYIQVLRSIRLYKSASRSKHQETDLKVVDFESDHGVKEQTMESVFFHMLSHVHPTTP